MKKAKYPIQRHSLADAVVGKLQQQLSLGVYQPGEKLPPEPELMKEFGVGRSTIREALGHLAIDKGRTVSWHTLDSLAALFRRHRADDSINKATSKLIRSDLILIDELMPKTMATATVDRLRHHAHVIITDSQDSYRLAQATAGKGVKPLA